MDYERSQQLLTHENLHDLLAVVTYKSGYALQVFQNPYEGPYLSIKLTTANASDAEKTVDLKINSPIPNVARLNAASFYEWLLERLIKVEIHEVCEFFQVEGRKWYDPHNPIEP